MGWVAQLRTEAQGERQAAVGAEEATLRLVPDS